MTRPAPGRVHATSPEHLDDCAIRAVAAGAGIELAQPVLDAAAARRRTAHELLEEHASSEASPRPHPRPTQK
jgi:hypothetical protein